MIIASAQGGTSIEDLAEHSPEKIIKVVCVN
jgi:succinyl-CoA synthetase beta subunit